jgi:hypothetical protein
MCSAGVAPFVAASLSSHQLLDFVKISVCFATRDKQLKTQHFAKYKSKVILHIHDFQIYTLTF